MKQRTWFVITKLKTFNFIFFVLIFLLHNSCIRNTGNNAKLKIKQKILINLSFLYGNNLFAERVSSDALQRHENLKLHYKWTAGNLLNDNFSIYNVIRNKNKILNKSSKTMCISIYLLKVIFILFCLETNICIMETNILDAIEW